MIAELDIYGVFIPPLLLFALIAYFLTVPVRWGLSRIGFYRLVWHRPLFDLAMFVILLGIVVLLSGSTTHPVGSLLPWISS
ncbi:Protein of unknown function [Faunimonas pinastri]|uniref:DUF1656 domain-containing protein n=1 Tax=Faunimonas pinastri TaxID=1855383 RepID=A0A1H9FZQ5_9HYPH|nr:DUF1656 domain-containing protein [Faunimonas pinastri]SEQ43360.1 Protein of unknown function [Faunimonas pinastri]